MVMAVLTYLLGLQVQPTVWDLQLGCLTFSMAVIAHIRLQIGQIQVKVAMINSGAQFHLLATSITIVTPIF